MPGGIASGKTTLVVGDQFSPQFSEADYEEASKCQKNLLLVLESVWAVPLDGSPVSSVLCILLLSMGWLFIKDCVAS